MSHEREHGRWTETQKMLLATIVFTAIVGTLTWLRYVSPWAWGE
jgi:hypothetical protein